MISINEDKAFERIQHSNYFKGFIKKSTTNFVLQSEKIQVFLNIKINFHQLYLTFFWKYQPEQLNKKKKSDPSKL